MNRHDEYLFFGGDIERMKLNDVDEERDDPNSELDPAKPPPTARKLISDPRNGGPISDSAHRDRQGKVLDLGNIVAIKPTHWPRKYGVNQAILNGYVGV